MAFETCGRASQAIIGECTGVFSLRRDIDVVPVLPARLSGDPWRSPAVTPTVSQTRHDVVNVPLRFSSQFAVAMRNFEVSFLWQIHPLICFDSLEVC